MDSWTLLKPLGGRTASKLRTIVLGKSLCRQLPFQLPSRIIDSHVCQGCITQLRRTGQGPHKRSVAGSESGEEAEDSSVRAVLRKRGVSGRGADSVGLGCAGLGTLGLGKVTGLGADVGLLAVVLGVATSIAALG